MEIFFPIELMHMENLKYRWIEKNDVSKIKFLTNIDTDIKKKLSLVNTLGFIVEKNKEIIAYFIYKSLKNKTKILDIFVKEDCRRQGVGSNIIEYILEKQKEKQELELMCPEERLDLQLFLKNQNFLAVQIKTEKSGDVYYKFSRKC